MKVRFSHEADRDLNALYEFIRTDSPRAAQIQIERILLAIERLPATPRKGPGKVSDTRELVIARTNHIAVYALTGDEILVVRVLHGKRRWPPGDAK